jgi:hypothetical protein
VDRRQQDTVFRRHVCSLGQPLPVCQRKLFP